MIWSKRIMSQVVLELRCVRLLTEKEEIATAVVPVPRTGKQRLQHNDSFAQATWRTSDVLRSTLGIVSRWDESVAQTGSSGRSRVVEDGLSLTLRPDFASLCIVWRSTITPLNSLIAKHSIGRREIIR